MRRGLFNVLVCLGMLIVVTGGVAGEVDPMLGLPPVPIPDNNLQSEEKIVLGDKLYNEKRFSTDGEVGCVTCHDPEKGFSHSPIQKIYKGWNFWTDDAEQVQALLRPFDDVTVVYGHVHQIQYNQIDNISFHAVMASAWASKRMSSPSRTLTAERSST